MGAFQAIADRVEIEAWEQIRAWGVGILRANHAPGQR
jgi:hypothetical protein